MSAHEATAPEPSPEGDEGKGRAGEGAGGFLRQHGRTLIVVVVVAIAAYAAFAGPGSDGGRDDRGDAGSAATTTAADAGTSAPGDDTAGAAPGATEVTDPASTSTLVPPDVENDRPAIDLANPPPPDDPVEVARWWAGTYTAYVGAEPPVDLVARVADRTAPALLDELRALPPAASYDAPLEVDGASAIDLPAGDGAGGGSGGSGDGAGGRRLRVSVQTPVALVVYDITLVQGREGGWLVSEAARV
jgi:hypothetical protein